MTPEEHLARAAKARKLADYLTGPEFMGLFNDVYARSVAMLPYEARDELAETVGVPSPSETTWSAVVAIVADRMPTLMQGPRTAPKPCGCYGFCGHGEEASQDRD